MDDTRTEHRAAGGGAPPFLVRTLGGGRARTLADHLAGPPDAPAPAVSAAGPAAGPVPARPAPGGSGPAGLTRTRGGASSRTLADHLRPVVPAAASAGPPARPAPAAVPAAPAAPASPPASPPASSPASPPASAALPVAVGQARESERRTVLDADDPVVTLRAADLPRSGRLVVVLEWDRPRTRAGVASSTDVHLGCLWQTTTGHSGLVQSIGGLLSAPGFGARQVLRLGPRSEDDGEPLTVDLSTVDTMARLLLFAVGQRSAPPWQVLGVRLTLQLPSGARVLMRPSAPARPATSVAIASVHVVEGDLVVRREDEPFEGPAREVALAYGWDLDWSADGTVPRT